MTGQNVRAKRDEYVSCLCLLFVLIGHFAAAKQKHPKFLPEESRQSVMENLHSVLFDKQYGLGLEGNRLNYMEPENSNIAQVLVRGTGIPITLSAIYMAVR